MVLNIVQSRKVPKDTTNSICFSFSLRVLTKVMQFNKDYQYKFKATLNSCISCAADTCSLM